MFGRLAKGFFVTIRGKILLAFMALAAITSLLGLYAVCSVVGAGRLVVQTYDKPLMAISYARLAQVDFTAMRLALERRAAALDEGIRHEQDVRLDELAASVHDDLTVARERSSSARGTEAGRLALRHFDAWDRLRRTLTEQELPAVAPPTLHSEADKVLETLDTLNEIAADDGFRDRERALGSIERYRRISISAAVLALFMGLLVAIMLVRRMVHPIAIASRAAGRIAAGELDVDIAPAGRDELGQLLSSMMVMRDNIRAMVEKEVSARRSAQSRLVDALESSHDGFALIDSDRRIVVVNSQMAVFFPDCADGLGAGAALPAEIEPAMAEATQEMQLADSRWVRTSRSATPNGGWVLIATDITLLKDREATLRAARDEAEAANRAKTDFLTNMSHELRTPLSAVIGFSELIAHETLGPVGKPQYRDFAADILHSGRHLLDVITDILDIAKAQSGNIALRLRPVRVQAVMRDAVRIVRNRADAVGIDLDVEMDDRLPPLTADAVRLRQVLLNLLSNAIKFTPRGGTVSIRAEQRGTGVVLSVRDTGIGMAKHDIPRALEPFVQVDTSLNRRCGGTGLGLPLSNLFVELHGGHLTIDSAPGLGTTVRVFLPGNGPAGVAPAVAPRGTSLRAMERLPAPVPMPVAV